MRTFKVLAASGALVALGYSAAFAGNITPVSVTNVGANFSDGTGLTISESGNPESIYYAGPISFTFKGKSWTVFCDDLYNVVYIGSSEQYYLLDSNGANAYLSGPTLSPTQTTTDEKIAGLAYYGTLNANSGNPLLGAEVQLAIWELEYGNITDTHDAGVQTAVNGYIGNALTYYANMLSASYAYYELESPTNAKLPGTIDFTSQDQVQGQIIVADPRILVPEPASWMIFFAGLTGLGLFSWRNKKKLANANFIAN